VPHGLGTASLIGVTGQASAAGPTGAADPSRCGRACPVAHHWSNTPPLPRAQLGRTRSTKETVGLIEWMRVGSVGSMGPLVRPINHHNHHSKAILGVPEGRRFISRHGVGPAAPPNRQTEKNRPKEPTLNRLRSSDQERPGREAVDHRAGQTP
jgi:hypothetical protein